MVRPDRRLDPLTKPLIALAVALATVLAYLPAISSPFVMDDAPAIAENASIRQLTPLRSVLQPPGGSAVSGRPVVNLSLAVNYAVNELLGVEQAPDPGGPRETVGYHVVNILFHLATGALLFGILRRTIRSPAIPGDWHALADPLAGIVCALWLLHPIQSEVVDYVIQRTEGFASLFYAATLYASVRAWDARSSGGRAGWYVTAVIAAVLGVGSKEIAISAPLAVVLYDRAFRLPSWSSIFRPGHGRGWLYLALAGAVGVSFALFAAGGRGSAAGFNVGMPWYDYLSTQCWAIAHYLRLVVWPAGLAVDYGTERVTGLRVVPGLLLLVALGTATLVAWTRLLRYGWLAFLGAWFFMLLAPSSSVVSNYLEVAAERRIYLALVAVLVVAVVGAEWLRRRFLQTVSARQASLIAGGVALAFGGLTAMRSHTYSSAELLWRDNVEKVPQNPRGYDNLGTVLAREGPAQYPEAESMLRRAMAMDTTCLYGCAPLASIMVNQGRLAEAAPLLERIVAHTPKNAPAERRLALVLMRLGLFERAVPHLAHLAAQQPLKTHLIVLGAAEFAAHRQEDGVDSFQTAARLFPADSSIGKLGTMLYTLARSDGTMPSVKELAIGLAAGW